MEEHELLVRHTRTWATTKSRDLDEAMLREVLSLRDRYDDLPYGTWPKGSAERLLLQTWPAYGAELPDLAILQSTLDTFWSFLRATGRMSAQSASPAELRKEAKRSLPKMEAAHGDPHRHSSTRVMLDFGKSIGVSLDDAESPEELQRRLDEIQTAWNDLPQDERLRRMPDPSPKGSVAAGFTAMAQAEGEADDLADVPGLTPSDPRLSARDARDSAFVRTCFALAEWVGEGREATSRGLLRPAVAREAYQHLDLWPWDRARDAMVHDDEPELDDPKVDAIMADAALNSWRSAGDCLALDRLWYPLEFAGIVERHGARAKRVLSEPQTDEEWARTAVTLLLGLVLRLGSYAHEPLPGVLLRAHADGGTASLNEIRQWWDTRCPDALRGYEDIYWAGRLDGVLFHFADCNLWHIEGDTLTLTALGNDFTIVYVNSLDEGIFED